MITWNPNDKGSDTILSDGNLRVFLGGTTSGLKSDLVRATDGKVSGVWYWEIECVSNLNLNMFLGITSQTSTTWSDINHRAYRPNGYKWLPDAVYGDSFTSGDTIGIAVNLDSKQLVFYKNGISQGIAFNNLSNIVYYPSIQLLNTGNRPTFVANFGATPFKYPIPEGYLPYDYKNADWFHPKKHLIQSNADILTINSNNDLEVIKSTLPVKSDFEIHGFSEPQPLIEMRTEKNKKLEYQSDLEKGKVYSLSVDRTEIPVIEKIEIE